jgi:hypothetical protein
MIMKTAMKMTIHGFTILGAAMLLSACYEDPDVTVHEAGEYKGDRDPLMQADADSRATTLAERFNMVQADR